MKHSTFARFARAFLKFCAFRSHSHPLKNVKRPILALCGRHVKTLRQIFVFCVHFQIPNLNLIPGLLVEIFLAKQLGIIDE